MMVRWVLGVLLLFPASAELFAADLEREARIAEEIEDAIVVGGPIRLQAGEIRFLAIHTESHSTVPEGGVIVLHGFGAHPDWVDVVQPLRSELPASGWETLSLQMPVASADASEEAYTTLVPEAYARISAGIEFFQRREITNVVLVGHSFGARMGVEYLAVESPAAIQAMIAVGLSVRQREPEQGVLAALAKLNLPLLDIYGSRDLETVTRTAGDRAAAARRAKNAAYRQVEVPGADHFFRGLEDVLIARVQAWIKRTSGPGETGAND